MTSANQTLGGYKPVSLVASQQGRTNQHEPACFRLPSPWSFPSRSGIRLYAVVQPWLSLHAAIHFAMECCAPCSAVLRHSPSSWATVVHWSVLMPKALRSSRKHPIEWQRENTKYGATRNGARKTNPLFSSAGNDRAVKKTITVVAR